jgi:hypothetical protein
MGELIGLRRFAVERGLCTVTRRDGAIASGLRAFFGRSRPVIRSSRPISRGAGAVIRRLLTLAPVLQSLLRTARRGRMPSDFVPSRGAGVSTLGHAITRGRDLIALVCRQLSSLARTQACVRLTVA